MVRRTNSIALPDSSELGIVGTLLFVRLDFTPAAWRRQANWPQVMAQCYDRFPMGKGQAPGIETGLGVCGTGSSAAGWASRSSGAVRRRGTAGFFLAAFFLADFLVGFFLGAFRATAVFLPPERRLAADAPFLPFFAAAFEADFLGDWAAAARVTRFFFAPAFGLALLRPAFFGVAMPSPVRPCGRSFLVKRGLDLTHDVPVQGIGVEREIPFPCDSIRNRINCGPPKLLFVG